MTPTNFRSRLGFLLGCLVAGLLAGLVGQCLTGSSAWFLAVPACIVAGWWRVANPEECLPPDAPRQP